MSSPPSHPRVGVAVFILHPTDENSTAQHLSGDRSQPSSSPSFKFLLGKRLGSHGAGTWALPGGHLEFGERLEDCAVREVLEETGLDIEDVKYFTATNDVMPPEQPPTDDGIIKAEKIRMEDKGKHYVTIYMTARVKANPETGHCRGLPEGRLLEPNKCAGWEWASWEDLLRWAEPQLRAVRGRETMEKEEVPRLDGSNVEETAETRKLFLPLLTLLVERPGEVPYLA